MRARDLELWLSGDNTMKLARGVAVFASCPLQGSVRFPASMGVLLACTAPPASHAGYLSDCTKQETLNCTMVPFKHAQTLLGLELPALSTQCH